jgi:hypothetical protein
MKGRLLRRLREFGGRQDGQVMLFVILIMVALLAFMLSIPNVTYVTTAKMRAQTAADSGAYTASIWLARALNLIAILNVGIKWMYIWIMIQTMLMAVLALLDVLVFSGIGTTIAVAISTGIQFIFFAGTFYTPGFPPPLGSGPAAIKQAPRYKDQVKALKANARWFYGMQTDIATTFPGLAIIMGTAEAKKNMGGDFVQWDRGGFALVLPNGAGEIPLVPDKSIFLKTLEQYSKLFEDGPSLGEEAGDESNSFTFNDDLSIEAKASTDRWDKVTVYQRWSHSAVEVYQKWRHKVFRGITRERQKKFLDPGEAAPYASGAACLPPPLPLQDWELIDVNSWDTESTQVQSQQFEWKGLSKSEQDKIRKKWEEPQDNPVNSAAEDLRDQGFSCPVGNAWKVPKKVAEDTSEKSESEPENQQPIPRRVDPDHEPMTVAFSWQADLAGSPGKFGPEPVMARALFPGQRVAPVYPLTGVGEAHPYLDIDNPKEADYFYAPQWDAKLRPISSEGAGQVSNENGYKTQASRGGFDIMQLLGLVLLH